MALFRRIIWPLVQLLGAAADTVLDEQFCQNYYTLGGDCSALRSTVRSEVRGKGTPTLELGDPATQPAMVFFHGWPDTSALWANQFAEFCGDNGGYFCVAPSWMDFNPDAPPAEESQLRWSNQVEAFHDVVSDLGLKDITLVIFDFGAIIGYQFLWRYSDIVSRVVALDIGMKVGLPTVPYEGMINDLRQYQQNNINAFLSEDDAAMAANLEIQLRGSSPCDNCSIAPNSTVGVGAKTGWPYRDFVRMDETWTSAFDVPVEQWQFNFVPSFPEDIPLLFLYSSTMFHDKSFRDWIDEREDGLSEHLHMKNTDHWIPVRVPRALNDKMTEWFASTAACKRTSDCTSVKPEKDLAHLAHLGHWSPGVAAQPAALTASIAYGPNAAIDVGKARALSSFGGASIIAVLLLLVAMAVQVTNRLRPADARRPNCSAAKGQDAAGGDEAKGAHANYGSLLSPY
ncbi:hypothetical protein ACHAWF_010708 [Thalassiosira exigua]